MTRGDIVTIADQSGDFSRKPRPALVVQNDAFNETHASVSVCLITSRSVDAPLFRLRVPPSDANGLKFESYVEIDKLQAVWTHRIGRKIGIASADLMLAVDEALRLWLNL